MLVVKLRSTHAFFVYCENAASKEWDDSQELTDFKQPPKKTRFKLPVKEEELLELSKRFVPANTKKNTMWAYKVFSDWLTERNNNTENSVWKICWITQMYLN